ncbi:MAG: segregation/condensation protein A [Oscillospiraceae bacterium]|nr:segregation/condensation protein A [Oscillospiraceae bacterium]MBR4192731.1 segregation/condensation protein A [Oscillospiraceae bacterium]
MTKEPNYHLTGVVKAKDETAEDFDGPLDLILLLLSKNKIEIQDVSITAILEQYLAWMEEMKRMDMEIASEFIAMASHLMLIKTKMLLSAAEQAEALSEMEQLIQSLQERQRQEALDRIRSAASVLEQRNELGLGLFTKAPEPYQRDRSYRYRHEPADLLRAFETMSERSKKLLPPPRASFEGIVGREPYPVTKKTAELLKKLLLRGVSRLRRLFAGSRSRSEIVATFLAVLELCKSNAVELGEENGDTTVRLLRVPGKEEANGT